jgi:hypothetical protein
MSVYNEQEGRAIRDKWKGVLSMVRGRKAELLQGLGIGPGSGKGLRADSDSDSDSDKDGNSSGVISGRGGAQVLSSGSVSDALASQYGVRLSVTNCNADVEE